MKLQSKLLCSLGATLSSFGVPLLARAANEVESGLSKIGSMFPSGPFSGARSLSSFIVVIIQLMLQFAGLIAVMFIIYGGYLYITSGGNGEQAEQGKNTLVNAIIGVVMIILSYVIINVVVNTLKCNGVIFC